MKFALLGAAALGATALASPSHAQAVISDPGYCAQFYPDANCQNLGPGNPYTSDGWRTNYPDMQQPRVHHAHRDQSTR